MLAENQLSIFDRASLQISTPKTFSNQEQLSRRTNVLKAKDFDSSVAPLLNLYKHPEALAQVWEVWDGFLHQNGIVLQTEESLKLFVCIIKKREQLRKYRFLLMNCWDSQVCASLGKSIFRVVDEIVSVLQTGMLCEAEEPSELVNAVPYSLYNNDSTCLKKLTTTWAATLKLDGSESDVLTAAIEPVAQGKPNGKETSRFIDELLNKNNVLFVTALSSGVIVSAPILAYLRQLHLTSNLHISALNRNHRFSYDLAYPSPSVSAVSAVTHGGVLIRPQYLSTANIHTGIVLDDGRGVGYASTWSKK